MPISTVNPPRRRSILARYTRWLHTMWPAGTVEKLPRVNEDYSTNVPGVYVVGDLTGVPLLKFSADSGARAVQTIATRAQRETTQQMLDLVIVGGGVSGMAAALEARKLGLRFELLEAAEPFSTIVNFPRGKPIYTYPTDMTPAGELTFRSEVHPKEELLRDMQRQTAAVGIVPKMGRAQRVVRKGDVLEVEIADQPSLRARHVIIAIGRSGNFRKLGVPGEESGKVYNRLHDPKEFAGRDVLVVGGGDSALETAIAVAESGGRVTLSYRKPEFSRPKPDNVERLGQLRDVRVMLGSRLTQIDEKRVELIDANGQTQSLPNDAVFAMIGREPPLDFFRRSGIAVSGDRGARWWIGLIGFLIFCNFLYHWKKNGVTITGIERIDRVLDIGTWWEKSLNWFPHNVPAWLDSLGPAWNNPAHLLGVLNRALGQPGFYYSLAYCLCVVGFGIDRIRRRRTPYVTWQTVTLMSIQCLLLFLVPYILLPWLGQNGWFAEGSPLVRVGDALFERYDVQGYDRAYWRSFGFVLAWPLFFYNVFTDQPMWAWLVISLLQTFVLIPTLIYFYGKGVYCGWICSCGALAETLGDRHRTKMPHGPFWNRFNMVGQVFLAFAFLLLLLRVAAWATPAPERVRITSVRFNDYSSGHSSIEFDRDLGAAYRWPTGRLELPDGRTFENLSKTNRFSVDADVRNSIGATVLLHRSALSRAHGWFAGWYEYFYHHVPIFNYAWFVDLLWAGIIGVGLYFWFSGRVWCRFACPLAALMHIYARFSRFRILADKKKCISCNVCTSVCHQGIDIMSFANKGMPMEDPQCVRCSACVQSCPTGVLSFGQVDRRTGAAIRTDPKWLAASPVLMREIRVNGRKVAV